MLGVALSALAAALGLASELAHWLNPTWPLLIAQIAGPLSLLWYAWDTVTTGYTPLNRNSVQDLRHVNHLIALETRTETPRGVEELGQ